MSAWFRTFVSRHLVADDPWPQYSGLDLADGLIEAPVGRSKELAEIEARLVADRQEVSTGVGAQSVRDRVYLLALVTEQSRKLEAVAGLVENAAKYGTNTVSAAEVQAVITEQSAA
jgi:FPC/CPF motif-containing protein YcgG